MVSTWGWIMEKRCPSRQPADVLTAWSAQQILALSQVRWMFLRRISEAPHHLSDLLPFMICCCFLAFSSCTYQSLFLTERSKSSQLVSLAQVLRHRVGVKHTQRKVHKCKESPLTIGQFSFHQTEREQPPLSHQLICSGSGLQYLKVFPECPGWNGLPCE